MQEDKQIYAYSWQQDVLKKIKNYFKREKKTKDDTPKKQAQKLTVAAIDQPVKQKLVKAPAVDKPKPKEIKKTKPPKKEKISENRIFKKERREKTLTIIIGSAIILVVISALLIQNNILSVSRSGNTGNNQVAPSPTTDTKDGQLSISPTITDAPTYSPIDTSGCVVGGCNGEICADKKLGNVSSICLYQEKFACYKSAVCERQRTGNCGWTQTEELRVCLETYSN